MAPASRLIRTIATLQKMVRRFYDFEMERYLRGRARFANRESPVVEMDMQSYFYYHEGAVVMYTMRR
jgi:hypothetical protein